MREKPISGNDLLDNAEALAAAREYIAEAERRRGTRIEHHPGLAEAMKTLKMGEDE